MAAGDGANLGSVRINFFVAVGIVGAAAMLAACGSENRAEPTTTTRDGTTIAAVTTSSGTCRGCTTRITYTPRKPDGSEPTDAESEQARRIIDERVAEFGIDHDVTVDGKTVVATLRNDDGPDAEEFGRMPKMYVRPVLQSAAVEMPPGQSLPVSPSTAAAPPAHFGNVVQDARDPPKSDPAVQVHALTTVDCKQPDPLKGNDDPNLPLVTCSDDGTEIYLLDKSRLDGTEIRSATSELNEQHQFAVTIAFKPLGADAWAKLTEEYAQKQLAFTIDTTVVTAPLVQPGPQLGGTTQITGRFTSAAAQALARTINRATTPLSFQVTTKEVLRPTK